jgi:peptide/nickel transport system substrate-binding protein/oligopeptide transport system substrate-binding protein
MRLRFSSIKVLKLFMTIMVLYWFYPVGGFSAADKEIPLDEATEVEYGGIYRRGLVHDPNILDPAKMTDIYEEVVTQQLFEGLVQYSDNLMVIPGLAESWKSSRDNLRWVFKLKEGATFHNGREVTAQDFVYTYTRILDPQTESGASSLLSRIKGATDFREGRSKTVQGLRALDTYTLEIELAEPFPPFVAMMAMVNFGVVPGEEVERLGDDFGLYPVGTGPFRFERWSRNEEISLTAYEDYHEGRPYLDQVLFKIFPVGSTEQMFSEFEIGNLEDSFFPVDKREAIETGDKFQLLRRPSLTIRFFTMNNSTEPLDSSEIRKAINYAIDKRTISIELGRGRLIPATGLIPTGMFGHNPENLNYPYSPEKARELLERAGFPDGRGLPQIQFWSSVTSKGPLAEDEAVTKYLSEVGFKIKFNYLTEWPEFKKKIEQGEAPVFKYSWQADVPDPDNIISSIFHSKSPHNLARYLNPEVDNLIEKAQIETDYSERASLYVDIQEMIMEDAPVILLNYLSYERVFQPYVRNFEGKALGDHYFSLKRVWLDR